MIQPTPAIVAQSAVRPLPRVALLLLCVAYVVAGFVGREPWKAQDMTAFGYMFELARGSTSWLVPTLVGLPPEFESPLTYWLGAWAIRATAPLGLPADLAARLPFVGLLVLTLTSTWWAAYHLARRSSAQPVAFAFGGEARPVDYARALADAALLAFIACLGLAQLSHETTPALTQLACTSLSFYGLAALAHGGRRAWAALALGLLGLTLGGSPTLAWLFAIGGAVLVWREASQPPDPHAPVARPRRSAAVVLLALAGVFAALATGLDLWRWRMAGFDRDWQGVGRLLLWFTWPAWPLAAWTVWRWRQRLLSAHLAIPLWFLLVTLLSALSSTPSDRALLLGLPAWAALAAFALPTFSRSVSALIDWFTLLFFTGCVVIIWVVWISLQTGVPAKPAANVARLAPGFEPSFSLVAFVVALAGTLAWGALVRWRVGRHRAALWKTLVLPAGGAALCWLLVMTLWIPVLNYARSYVPSVRGVVQAMDRPGCVEVAGLTRGQLAALRYHGGLTLRDAGADPQCPWRVLSASAASEQDAALRMQRWQLVSVVRRPTDPADTLHVFRQAARR